MAKPKTAIMHQTARDILTRHQATGDPFAFFLSSWAFDKARAIMFELLGQPVPDVQVRIGLEGKCAFY